MCLRWLSQCTRPLDREQDTAQHGTMNGPPSREEVDAKLETARMSSEAFFARMDARCTQMDARCTRMEAAMSARMDALAAALIERMDQRIAALEARIDAKISSLYKAMIITAVTSTITIILGVGAINATVFTGMLAAMDKGEALGAMYTKLGQRMLEQDAQFNRMMLKQREDFARLETRLDARLEEEKAERARRKNQRAARP